MSYKMPPRMCLSCGRLLNAVSGVNSDAAPSAGSFTVCIGCAHVMAVAPNLTLRDLTDEERREAAFDHWVQIARQAIREMNAARQKRDGG